MQAFATLGYRGQVRRLRSLAGLALAAFDLDGARLTLLAHFENTTFRVTTPDERSFVLRIHRAHGSPSHPPRSVAEVRSELLWLEALRHDTGLAVPTPRHTTAGDPLVIVASPGVPEPRCCVLFEWMDGRFLNAGLTSSHLERVGTFIARLHEHALAWTPPPEFERWQVGTVSDTSAAAMLEMVAAHCPPSDVSTVQAVITLLHGAQRELHALPGSHGLIHGDLHQENYLFRDGTVQAIDFDDCGFGPLLYDLSIPLNELWSRADLPELRAALLRGYQQRRPLPADHARYLEIFDIFRVLQLTLWHIENHAHPAFTNWQAEVRQNLDWLARTVRAASVWAVVPRRFDNAILPARSTGRGVGIGEDEDGGISE